MRVRSAADRSLNRWLLFGPLAFAVCGCAGLFADGGAAPPAPSATLPADPVAAFAASAAPGSETVAPIPEAGGSARMRLLRSYNAASGRECREVLIGAGLAERTRLVCRNGTGGWVAARPLLSGGGGARP